ncbi:histidine phosphatase family protein [Aeromicrobium sp. UC242_57]|uniref:histidine phosphatase family protein n=1 Tax=Aeromicrobium sp. UC242_57 TaxID=3374624 RepID=UPI0037B472B0
MRLILIRHGQTPANVDGVLESTVPGPGLTELGLEQAAELACGTGPRTDRRAVRVVDDPDPPDRRAAR